MKHLWLAYKNLPLWKKILLAVPFVASFILAALYIASKKFADKVNGRTDMTRVALELLEQAQASIREMKGRQQELAEYIDDLAADLVLAEGEYQDIMDEIDAVETLPTDQRIGELLNIYDRINKLGLKKDVN